jgi:pimeloyl-ACP methyl ester carboxylesterase
MTLNAGRHVVVGTEELKTFDTDSIMQTRSRFRWLLAVLFVALSPCLPAPAAEPPAEAPELFQTFRIPLAGGKLPLSSLLGKLLDYAGLDGKLVEGLLDANVDVTGTTGRLTMKTVAYATRGIITMTLEPVEGGQQSLAIRLDRLALRENRGALQGRLMKLVEAWDPAAAAKVRDSSGFFVHASKGKPAPLADAKLPGHVIVLIHGLDEPGWCWDTIAPALVKAGHTVCEFRYPNDQAIAKSTKLFAAHLVKLRAAGAKEATILAHSMGSLVSRDVLTNESYYAGKGDGGGTYPAVRRLIMIGPPNHGSALAELQVLGEVREQVVRLFSGDGHLFGAFFDGAGEAKEDLLPGSPFLKALNARPLPAGVKMTILASQVSPVSGKTIEAMRAKLREKVPEGAAWGPDQIGALAASLADGVGDGAVPVASTRLDGVTDHVMVQGNHTSMLHKKEGDHAALNVIAKRLEEDAK